MNSSLFTPDYSHLTGLLKHLNDEELQEILNSDDKIAALVSDLKQVQDIEAEREIIVTSNKSISEYNLSKKPTLDDHKRQVEDTRKIAFELKDSLFEKKRKIESHGQGTPKETMLALLQAATSEKEEEAEAVVELFLQNELSAEDFLAKYLDVRKVAHLRHIKSEKLANLLQEDGSQVSPPYRPQRLRKPPPPPVAGPLPYPTGNPQNNVAPVRQAPEPPRTGGFMYPTPYGYTNQPPGRFPSPYNSYDYTNPYHSYPNFQGYR